MILPNRREYERSNYAHENAAKGAATGNGKIKPGQMLSSRFQPRQFSMTDHARREEHSEKYPDLLYDMHISSAK